MTVLLRLHVLSLLVGSVVSLNHGNFIGGGNFDIRTDADTIGDYYEFFTPLPPVPPPPTESPTPAPVAPTKKPTKSPTKAPVVVPTRKPIPAGRWPSPVAPVPKPPVKKPHGAPVPAGRWPHKPAPNKPPTYAPHPKEPKLETRISTYNAEWGYDVNDCEYVAPNVFFTCHEGGYIGTKSSTNANCTRVASDRLQCTQLQKSTDSSIEYTCSGIRKAHLMSTATVGPNFASDCKKDGNILKYLTLSRECDTFTNIDPTCNGGMPWKQEDGTSYCTSPAVCRGYDTCSELKLEPLAMSNTNTDLRCSRVDPHQDLQFNPFVESFLSSVSVINWRVSGQQRGCLWKSAPLVVQCEDGGKLEFEKDYSFCSVKVEGKETFGECESFAPFSTESEESTELYVRCTGKSESQLEVLVEIQSQDLPVECLNQGTIIQSVMLSRGCGEVGTDGFTLVNHPSFCDAEDQVFTLDDNESHCFVGNTCPYDYGCTTLHMPQLNAGTGAGPTEQCTSVVV